MNLGCMTIPNIPIVLNIKCAHDTKHLLVVVSQSICIYVGPYKRVLSVHDYD
jgi:hypothetical protein